MLFKNYGFDISFSVTNDNPILYKQKIFNFCEQKPNLSVLTFRGCELRDEKCLHLRALMSVQIGAS